MRSSILMTALMAALLVACGESDGSNTSSPAPATSGESNSSQNGSKGAKNPKKKPVSADATPGAKDDPTVSDNEDDPVQGDEDCYGGDEFICAVEEEITRQTNELRTNREPLIHHAHLSFVSRDWSEKQRASGNISHAGFPNARATVYRDEFGSSQGVGIYAENVAYSFSSSASAEEVARVFVNMWWNSSGHRQNMLGNYEVLGSGVARSGNTYYATQIFGQVSQ